MGCSTRLQSTPRRRPPLVRMPGCMDAPLAFTALAAAVPALCALALAAFGWQRPRHRGWRWWSAAAARAALGAALAGGGGSLRQGAAALLLLQWPVFTLMGLRAFHARHALPGRVRFDWAVLSAAGTGVLFFGAWDSPHMAWGVTACAMALHAYVAAVLLRAPGGSEGAPMVWLGVLMSVLALGPALAALGGGLAPPPLPLAAASAALGLLASTCAAFVLVCERGERQLRNSRRRLRALANMDALTQVPNRRRFHELATLALRTDPPGSAALLMFDIDHFKGINDLLGHATGDRALTLVSGSVVENLRAHDVAGRLGGDEFALLLRRADMAVAMAVAERIARAAHRRGNENQLPHLTLSFGMVQVSAGERVEEALRRADQAMYEAKRQGRSRAVAAEGDEGHPVFSESQRLGLMAS